MKQIPAYNKSQSPVRTGLYKFVYGSVVVRGFVCCLLLSFMLQATDRVEAAEPTSSPENIPPELITVTDDLLPIVAEEMAAPIEENITEAGIVTDTEGDAPLELVASTSVDDVVLSDGIDSDIDASPPDESPPFDTASSTEATTTDETIPTLTVESDSMIQFNKDSCLAVEDGSFYCQQATTTTTHVEEGLLSLPDADGDLEIYLKRGEEFIQITHNTADDASPYYDPASDSIVFHRFIDERYQIVVYDVASKEEVLLTDTSTNNMEPFRADNYIAWQHWDNDAWQIMLYDGAEIKQLTSTVEHNLAPVIRNNLVVWHRIMYSEKTIEVYDLSSGAYMTIRDDNGGTITNPRMVLVYDATMENGDTMTRGYDLVTGELTSFTSEPAPVPTELPEPDSTGETKALLTTKSGSKEEFDDSGIPPTSDDGFGTSTDLVLPPNTATSSLTLDLTVADVDSSVSIVDTVVQIPDLVVEPYIASSSPTVIPVVE